MFKAARMVLRSTFTPNEPTETLQGRKFRSSILGSEKSLFLSETKV